jgi:hypothetical protein
VMVSLYHVPIALMEENYNMKELEVGHRRELVDQGVITDKYHECSIDDQIEMMMLNDYHNKSIDYYHYLLDPEVDSHHHDDDGMSMEYASNDEDNLYLLLVKFERNNLHYYHHYLIKSQRKTNENSLPIVSSFCSSTIR